MHSHLAIIGTNGELALKPDASITITEKNPMFNDTEMFSRTFQLPLDKNRKLLKNLDNVNANMRAVDLEGERFNIVVDGVPLRSAVLRVQENAVIGDTIDVNLDATNRTFKDMIQNMRCRDVSVDSDIAIGEKVGNVQLDLTYQTDWAIRVQVWHEYENQMGVSEGWRWSEGYTHILEKPKTVQGTFEPPVLGFSYPGICATGEDGITALPRQDSPLTIGDHQQVLPLVNTSYINTQVPFGETLPNGQRAVYCNSRVCYAHHALSGSPAEGYETASELVPKSQASPIDKHNFGPYWVLDAERPASGICFYVGYFLERLFKHLGVAYDMTSLTNITDFRYMCFFNTACKYEARNTSQTFASIDEINAWLSSRGCGGTLNIDLNDPSRLREHVTYDARDENYGAYLYLTADEIDYYDKSVQLETGDHAQYSLDLSNQDGSVGPVRPWTVIPGHGGMQFQIDRTFSSSQISANTLSACVQRMYATSDNFPDQAVTDVIESLENTFGVRFCYDADTNKVTVRLLRDMFCSNQAPIKLKGSVLSMRKKTEKITGVRVGYAAEADAQEQRDNVLQQKKDYDTTYNYIDYQTGRTKLQAYADVLKVIDIGNMNCYVDPATGNAYRIKIDADAKTVGEMKPSLFEVGALKSLELGDCSVANADYVKEYRSRFEPIICNILNRDAVGDIMLVPFIDEDMEHEFLPMKVQNVFAVDWGEVNATYDLQLIENYDPTSSDDGQSPLMSHDWGLTVGILRPGSGSNQPYEFDEGYDGFGNSRWGLSSQDYAVCADSYDPFGRFLGTSAANSFALKPAAYKPFRYYTNSQGQVVVSTNPADWTDSRWLVPCDDDVRQSDGQIVTRIKSRGTADTFMAEFVRFLLHRQRYEVEALCTAAELADMRNKWLSRWEINGRIGFINKYETEHSEQTGAGRTKIEFFAI